jgi:hypothetical protein
MPGETGVTCGDYTRVLCFFIVREAAGASSARHSLRPLIAEGRTKGNTSRKKACGENAETCLTVVASAAKQSTFPLAAPWIASLRSQ